MDGVRVDSLMIKYFMSVTMLWHKVNSSESYSIEMT